MIESHVLRTTNSFRSEQDVEDLWDDMCERVVRIVDDGLAGCEDPEVFLGTKLKILTFVQALEVRLRSRCSFDRDDADLCNSCSESWILYTTAQRAFVDTLQTLF